MITKTRLAALLAPVIMLVHIKWRVDVVSRSSLYILSQINQPLAVWEQQQRSIVAA